MSGLVGKKWYITTRFHRIIMISTISILLLVIGFMVYFKVYLVKSDIHSINLEIVNSKTRSVDFAGEIQIHYGSDQVKLVSKTPTAFVSGNSTFVSTIDSKVYNINVEDDSSYYESIINEIITILIIITTLMLLAFFIGTRTIYNKNLKPLRKLYLLLDELSKYDLNNIDKADLNIRLESLRLSLLDFIDNLGVDDDIIEEQVLRFAEALERKNIDDSKLRAQLLAGLHDFRTPLSTMMIDIENISDTKLREELKKEIEDLNIKITSLLTNDKTLIELVTSDRSEFVTEIRNSVRSFSKMYTSKDLIINFIAPSEEYYIEIGAVDFRIIIRNIFQNIYENSDESTDIYIFIKKCENTIILEFENTSKNARNVDFTKVFDKFYSTNRLDGNSGYGLYAVKKILDRNHGKIIMERNGNQVSTLLYFKIKTDETINENNLTLK